MPPRIAVLALALAAAFPTAAQTGGSRVEEEANRPMRMILEAAKIKGRTKPPETPPVPARPIVAAPRAASAPAAAPTPLAGPVATSPAPASSPASAPEGPPQSTVVTVEADAVPRPEAPATPPSAPNAEPEAVPADNLPPLRLINVVEPVTPRTLQGKLRGEVRVDVAFTVAADGSVTEPSVRASSHPQMNAAVLEAVGQWRYEPIARAREHAVQVVLRAGG